MTRFTARTSLFAVALAVVAAAGCKKESIDKHEVSAAATAALAVLPKDASMVFGVNLAKARDTEVWKKYSAQVIAAAASELAELKATCGIDPLTQIDSAAVSFGADIDDAKSAFAVVTGQLKEATVAKCVTDMAAKSGGAAETSKDGKLTVYTNKAEGKSIYTYWPKPDTIALAPGALDDPAPIKKLAEGGGGADQNAQLKELLTLTNTNAVLWGAGALPELARTQMKAMGYVPDGYFIEVDVPGDVQIGFGLRYEDDKSAESSFKLFKTAFDQVKDSPPLPQLKDVMKTVEIKHTGRMVKVTAKLTLAQIEELAGMAAMFGGGLGF